MFSWIANKLVNTVQEVFVSIKLFKLKIPTQCSARVFAKLHC